MSLLGNIRKRVCAGGNADAVTQDHSRPADVPVTLEEAIYRLAVEEKTMRRVMRIVSLGLGLVVLGVSSGLAQNVEQVKLIFEEAIPNIEGKSMVAVVVTYPPGAKSLAHHHARSAFIYAYVLSGAIRSQVDNQPVKVYQVGEGFYEVPGSHHRISENASDKEPASLLAVFVVDSKDNPLTVPDPK
jgi:quercetin dioxygenase-like cupin family protein